MKLISPSLTLLLLCTLLLLQSTSCGSEDNIDPEDTNDTFLDYQVFYDVDQDQTTITAHFKNGSVLGSEIILEENESITFNGDSLQYDPLSLSYSRDYEGQIIEGDFVFKSSEGKVYTSSLFSYESIEFPPSFSDISKSEGSVINWEGSSLGNDEFIEVIIGDPEQLHFAGIFHDGEGTVSVQVSAEELTSLSIGSWPAYMRRGKRLFFTDATRAGGRIVASYRSRTIQIEITE